MNIEYRNNGKIIENYKKYWIGYIIGSLGLVLGIIYLIIKYGAGPLENPYSTGQVVIITIIPIFMTVGYLLNKKNSLEKKLMITNKKLTEQNKELFDSYVRIKEADKTKSNFLMTMSHELRTPLNAVLVFAGLLKNGVYGSLNKHQEDSIEMILNSGQHLLSLIDNLLDLSKIEAGEMELILSEYQLKDVIEETTNTLKEFAEKKKLKIEVEGVDNLPTIYGDRSKVKYILMNLVENALKFTNEGEVSIKSKLNSNSFYLYIRDTGIGIKEEDYKRIFEEFVQLDSSSTREYGGAGLGLTISKRFIEMHHGRVDVESNYGSWTKFKVELPIKYN